MSTEIRVPTLGESVTEATVATWFKKPGDSVSIDEMLCELETDKVTVEVPSPVTGRLQEIIVKEGQTVSVDALLATLSKEENPNAFDVSERGVTLACHYNLTDEQIDFICYGIRNILKK